MTTETPTREQWTEIGRQLREPFPAPEIKQRKGRGGQQFDYIDARAVMDRLDAVIGPEHWYDSYTLMNEQTGAMLCGLTVHGITKYDVGYPNNPIGSTDKSGNPMSEEPLKDAASDSLKRAAVKWGIGRFLYQGGAPKADAPASNFGAGDPFAVPGDVTNGTPNVRVWLNSAINQLAERDHVSGPTVAQRGMQALYLSGSYTALDEENSKALTKWAVAELKKATTPDPLPAEEGSSF